MVDFPMFFSLSTWNDLDTFLTLRGTLLRGQGRIRTMYAYAPLKVVGLVGGGVAIRFWVREV